MIEIERIGSFGADFAELKCGGGITHEGHDEYIVTHRKVFDQHCFDEQYEYEPDVRTTTDFARIFVRKTFVFTRDSVKELLHKILPIASWLPRYEPQKSLLSDIVGGFTVGIMQVPQGMAYAPLAGLPVHYGLYQAFFPGIVYAIFGTSRQLSVGAESVTALLCGAVVNRYVTADSPNCFEWEHIHNVTHSNQHRNCTDPVEIVTALSLMVGFIQVSMGFLHFGFLLTYLSDQLVGGFTTGAAVIIMTVQLDKIFGVPGPKYDGPFKLYYIYKDLVLSLPQSNWITFGLSLGCIMAIYCGKTFINEKFAKRLKVPIPIDLIVIIITTTASYLLHLNSDFDVKVVGGFESGFPPARIPESSWFLELLPDAIRIAIVNYCLSVSMAQLFAHRHRYSIDPNQELFAISAVNLVNSFFSAFPAGASLPRSCVQDSTGSKSQIAGVVNSLVILIVMMWVAQLFKHLPMCVLACIIIVALKNMFLQLRDLKPLWYISKFDFSIFVVTLVATIIFDVIYGLAIGVAYAMFTVVWRSQRPPALILGKIPNTDVYMSIKRYKKIEEIPGVKIFRFDSALLFANASLFRSQLYRYIQMDFEEMKVQVKEEEKLAELRERELQKAIHSINTPRYTSRSASLSNKVVRFFTPKREASATRTLNGKSYEKTPLASGTRLGTLDVIVEEDGTDCATVGSSDKSPQIELGFRNRGSDRLFYIDSERSTCCSLEGRDNPHLHSLEERNVSSPPRFTIGVADKERIVPIDNGVEKDVHLMTQRPSLSRMQSLALERNPDLPHHIIIDASGFNYVDVMGVNMLIQIHREFKEINITLLLANCKTPVRTMFDRCDFYREVPKSCLYLSVQDAVMAALKTRRKLLYR